MQLITLNIWGGHVNVPLLKFIKRHKDIDIFCLQEVYHSAPEKISTEDRTHNLNIFPDIQNLLPSHKGFFRPVVNGIYGNAIFIKNHLEIVGEGAITIYHNPNYVGLGPTHSRKLQWVEYRNDTKSYSILNVHGLWNGKGKKDSLERILQSQRIREFMESIQTPKVVCGDFNLRPDTESMKILEKGMINLIKEYNISSTRTSLYPKSERFADYILTSPEIKINRFEVLPDEVSDHSPLFLDFE